MIEGEVWVHAEVETWEWWLVAFAMYAVGRFALAYVLRRMRP